MAQTKKKRLELLLESWVAKNLELAFTTPVADVPKLIHGENCGEIVVNPSNINVENAEIWQQISTNPELAKYVVNAIVKDGVSKYEAYCLYKCCSNMDDAISQSLGDRYQMMLKARHYVKEFAKEQEQLQVQSR